MINIVNIKGGLGNQMFGYAFFLALNERHPYALNLMCIEFTVDKHYGFELFKIFNIRNKWRFKLTSLFNHQTVFRLLSIKKIIQDNAIGYNPQLILNSGNNYYDGYWQSEQYFKQIEHLIRDKFTFKEHVINPRNKVLANELSGTESVAIHIRRGDYLLEKGWDISCSNYYRSAISFILNAIPNPVFYFFSDDIEWCRNEFKMNNCHYVDWNTGSDSWQDMYLMSKCKHNIIANSSFSWWGAWLNANPNKMVIAPSFWLPNVNTSGVIPDSWILLD